MKKFAVASVLGALMCLPAAATTIWKTTTACQLDAPKKCVKVKKDTLVIFDFDAMKKARPGKAVITFGNGPSWVVDVGAISD